MSARELDAVCIVIAEAVVAVGGLYEIPISAFACWLPFTKVNLKSQPMEDGCSPPPRTTENARIRGGDYVTWGTPNTVRE